MKIIHTVALASLLSVVGCVTPYQPRGATGGFTETQLDENVFKVSFNGNGYTSRERAADFALLRSAELTMSHGFKYFVIVDESEYVSRSSYTTPATSYTTANATAYGNSAYGSATTTTYGGQTYNFAKPRSTNTIVCMNEKPDGVFAYKAEFIYKNLTQKYGIGGSGG